jgi:GTPase SAR1 family protein
MLVGEGRAGKTSLLNSVMGNSAVSPESTCGIGQYTVFMAGKDGGRWRPHGSDSASSFEDALAECVKKTHLLDRECLTIVPKGSSSMRTSICKDAGVITNLPARSDVGQRFARSDVGQRLRVSAGASTAIPVNVELTLDHAVDSFDMAPILRQYYRRLSQNSDIVVKLFDLGGQEVFDCVHTYFMT